MDENLNLCAQKRICNFASENLLKCIFFSETYSRIFLHCFRKQENDVKPLKGSKTCSNRVFVEPFTVGF